VTTTRLKLNATLKIRKEMMALICANMIWIIPRKLADHLFRKSFQILQGRVTPCQLAIHTIMFDGEFAQHCDGRCS
jgi:hypothetical protein